MWRLRCRLERAWLTALRGVFRFDAWHARSPYACRPYKRRVVELANSLHAHTVVEIGCGLGEIVSRVKAQRRFGLDVDPRAIRAARFLHPRRIVWLAGTADMLDRQLEQVASIDCLIMVNWIHNLSSDELAAVLAPLLPRTQYLILDAVDSEAPGSYRFRHDFAFLTGLATQLTAIRVPEEPRRFLLFRASN
jgi:SAM-dependent methyltransferase